jgi:hypothetical protein
MEVPKRNKKEWKVKITEHRKVTAYESTFGPNHKLLRDQITRNWPYYQCISNFTNSKEKNYQLDIV